MHEDDVAVDGEPPGLGGATDGGLWPQLRWRRGHGRARSGSRSSKIKRERAKRGKLELGFRRGCRGAALSTQGAAGWPTARHPRRGRRASIASAMASLFCSSGRRKAHWWAGPSVVLGF